MTSPGIPGEDLLAANGQHLVLKMLDATGPCSRLGEAEAAAPAFLDAGTTGHGTALEG
ncbi:hypothetical protein [Actinocorallia longicatena]|uniref:hypothetical protein n=1 Tax=Actinocorallia longicatena TaxID=111803 RepID=UPI0031D33602